VRRSDAETELKSPPETCWARPTSPRSARCPRTGRPLRYSGERGAAAVPAELLELRRVHSSVLASVHRASREAVTAGRHCVEPGRPAAGLDDARDGPRIGGSGQCRSRGTGLRRRKSPIRRDWRAPRCASRFTASAFAHHAFRPA